MDKNDGTVARLLVECLEAEGVEYVFGIPGEENIYLLDALQNSSIRVIITRHEQGAAFMADMYGHLTGKAGVCFATLGPGALNLPLGLANAYLDHHPVVALPAQAGLNRLHKESHQVIDLLEALRPVGKWTGQIYNPANTPEMIRKAFKVAQSTTQGPAILIIPEDIEKAKIDAKPLPVNVPRETAPDPAQIIRATRLIDEAENAVIIAGAGVYRERADDSLIYMAEKLNIPVATTFLGKGAISPKHPLSMGTLGFMMDDFTNFGLDAADLVITVGYDLVEYSPAKWNPQCNKKILHINHEIAEVDSAYSLSVGIEGSMASALRQLGDGCAQRDDNNHQAFRKVHQAWKDELEQGAADWRCPLNPRRVIADIRQAMGEDDIVLCDTGAVKMWMSRLYPAYKPGTFVISNGLAPMGFALPGALGARLGRPESKVLAVMGDGSFLMNSQEIETALRENINFVILVWVDDAYGLIEWKQQLEFGRSSFIKFTNPDFVQYAESFGAKGYRIESADQLLPVLKRALDEQTVSVIACPVDYSENDKLTEGLRNWKG